VNETDNSVVLEDRDPFDYARATKFIDPSSHIAITFDLTIDETDGSPFFVDLLGPKQSCLARIAIDPKNRVRGKPLSVKVEADGITTACSATLDSQMLRVPNLAEREHIIGVSLQTGERLAKIDPQQDRPIPLAKYRVELFAVSNVSP
jgi:hypothetical protein